MHPTFVSLAPRLVSALRRNNFSLDGLEITLGDAGVAAMDRHDPTGVCWAASGADMAATVARAFIAHQPQQRVFFEDLFGTDVVDALLSIHALVADPRTPEVFHVAFDARPREIAGNDIIVFSDVDGSMAHPVGPAVERVLGVGSASLSLLASTPLTPTARVLDLGTGCGVQALAQATCARSVTATDVLDRAVFFAQATIAGAGLDDVIECRQGSWFEPVAGQQFDRIVANPPFVVGLPEVGHVYRDSGMNLDGATEYVVKNCPDFLAPSGTAHLLGAWIHTADQPWQQRVSQWIPTHGVLALFLQRDVADPSLYVDTWLRDEGLDLRDPDTAARAQGWLDHFSRHHVEGVGFGFIALKKISDELPSVVRYEDFTAQYGAHLGEEVEAFFGRLEWLLRQDEDSLLDARFALHPEVAVEDISTVDREQGMGFRRATLRISRMDGPRYQHEIDEDVLALLAGLNPQGLSLRDIIGLLSATRGVDEEELAPQVASIARDLIDHGFMIPAELL
ncbi:methyltransferase [Corynebacterium aquilae]|uniref:Uncharacterized protein n=1 Tax=Corynebacterium aquilae DSM 44791 TaxID=1431546 RepID=A0A1L7CGE1_9CORY|nr:methyltransferase [Corynebacterium aquilae]APT84896.1 hypothetical protein CAQU_07285 [Corynebacterium aquilae DSM 44791]